MQYKSKNHTKFLFQYHIIFVAKYRRGIFANEMVRNRTKVIMAEIASGYDFSIQTQEIDPNKPDHWHGLILSTPQLSPAQIVRVLKQESNHRLWSEFEQYLRYFYWHDNLLWTRGYFVSTVGNASAETIQAYINSQG